MIFKPVLVDQILAGNKTMTRRPVNFDNPKSHYWHENCRYKVGSKITIQANYNGPAPARGVVTGLRRERWIDLSEADARAEGFPLPGNDTQPAAMQFFSYVLNLYPSLDTHAECWVIEFELEAANAG